MNWASVDVIFFKNAYFYAFVVLLLLFFVNLTPAAQLYSTKGLLFYTNAFDEFTYLQYDVAREMAGFSSLGRWIVGAGHVLGLSGGYINLCMDLGSVLLFLIFCQLIFIQLGYSKSYSRFCSIALTFLPLCFGGFNPIVNKVFNYGLSKGLVYWISTPEAQFLPIVRTPEPQFSLVLLSAAVFLALRMRSFLILFLFLPFLYPFIALPTSFIVLAIYLKVRFPRFFNTDLSAAFAAFLSISLLLVIYFFYMVGPLVKTLMVNSHLPLMSFMFAVSFVIFILIKLFIKRETSSATLFIVISPLASVNFQIICGWLPQPNNFEQYFGVFVPTLIILMNTPPKKVPKFLVLVVIIVTMAISSSQYLRKNQADWKHVKLTPENLALLKSDSKNILMNDTVFASLATLMYPRQSMSVLSYERSFLRNEKYFQEYLCAKKVVLEDPIRQAYFTKTFQILDQSYRYDQTDFILSHIGRKTTFAQKNNPSLIPTECSPRTYHYIVS